jgi:DNA-binding FadR family transcriptional regulator
MKITRRQLRRIIAEAIRISVSKKEETDEETLDELDQGELNMNFSVMDFEKADRDLHKTIRQAKYIPVDIP